MSNYSATVKWNRNGEDFLANKYSRAHTWRFDGGVEVPASASPQIVPLPWSREENVDPEEAFVATLSSCHMLFFLSIASELGIEIDSYTDNAIGKMSKNEQGKIAITRVTLTPQIEFSGNTIPDRATVDSIHNQAHEQCFLANSVNTKIDIASWLPVTSHPL